MLFRSREVTGLGPTIWTKGHGLYREINKVIGSLTNQNPETENLFQNVAYYNYFLRPAYPKGASFKTICKDMDLGIAREAFCEIIQIIKPDYVYFFSKYAWDCLQRHALEFKNITMDYSPHPSCRWWNTKSYHLKGHDETLTGKEKFTLFLKDNQIF